jgi:hypothetical protein
MQIAEINGYKIIMVDTDGFQIIYMKDINEIIYNKFDNSIITT